jgi:hypothetical protein
MAAADTFLFNDSHFHLTNYIQRGTDINRFLEIWPSPLTPRSGWSDCLGWEDPVTTRRTAVGRPRRHLFGTNTSTLSALAISAIASLPRTLLPAGSTRGENTATPNLPGATATIPPPTPLFAGSPTV